MSNKTDTYKPALSEKAYEELYSKADILYLTVNKELKILSCNITAEEKLLYDRETLIGKNFLFLIEKKEVEHVKKAVNDCLSRGYLRNLETKMVRDDNHHLYMRINGIAGTDEDGKSNTIRFFITDISEVKRAEKKKELLLQMTRIVHGKSLNRELIEQVLDKIKETMNADGIGISMQDKRGENLILGRWDRLSVDSGTERDNENFQDWMPEFWKKLDNLFRSSISGNRSSHGSCWTGSLSDLALELQSDDGKDQLVSFSEFESMILIPFDQQKLYVGYLILLHKRESEWNSDDVVFLENVVTFFTDVTLNSGDESLYLDQKILSSLDIPVIGILQIQNNMIQFANKWILDFTGYSKEEIIQKDTLNLFDPDSRPSVQHLLNDEKSRYETCEVDILTKKGIVRPVECIRLYSNTDDTLSNMLYFISIDKRKQLQKQLLQARKMETMGMLAGGIVHDFNNLLACILGYSSLLSEEIKEDDPYFEDIQQINRTTEKATELTSRLMAYTQGGSYVVDELDINQLIKEVAGILSRLLERNISIRAELDPNLELIKADASQIQQAILQVVLNSRDAMPNGGKIIFQTRNVVLNENNSLVRFGGKPGKYVQISISDTGHGMSGDVKECIFKPYFTTKMKNAGKGLGLTMVYEIVENHRGFISVFSEKDRGTVFKMHFPITKKKTLKPRYSSNEKPPLGKETILLVDDEKVLRETARKMLTRYGYKVISVDSGTEAIAVYKKYSNRIDLVILDMMMPGIGFDKVLAWFKKLNPKIKIVASSGMGEKQFIKDDIHRNIAGHVQKPFQVRPLLKKVRSVLHN